MQSADRSISRHDAKVTAGRRLSDLLRTEILSGAFDSDQPMPTEAELMCQYRSGRNVVRAALDLLRRDGYVVRLQGRGTMVISQRSIHDLDVNAGIGRDYRGGGHRVVTRFRAVTEEVAPLIVAERLQIEPGSHCIVADYETLVDRQPYAVATSYLTGEPTKRAFEGDLQGDWYGDWFEVLSTLGVSIGRSDLQVEATGADEVIAELLLVAESAPLLRFERLLHDPEGRPIDFGFSRCRADRLVLRLTNS